LASGKRIFDVMDQVSPVTDQSGAKNIDNIRGVVTFKKVGFSYNTEINILEGIDFQVKPGQVIALVGASGSGKSTIANLIPRFYDVTSGSIEIDGVDIRQIRLASLRKQVGMIHQDTFLFSASIRDNLSYGLPEATDEEIIKAAKTAKLHDFIMSLPETYSTLVGERGITLSGGQKQRLAIARCLLTNPKILIMDDSTSSVDNQTEYSIQSALAEVFKGRTTFIIAHRLHSVEKADLILVLDHGKIVERGTHPELLAGGGLYKQLYGLQFQSQEYTAAFNSDISQVDVPLPVSLKETESMELPESLKGAASLKTSDELVYGKPYDSKVVQRLVGYFKTQKSVVIITILATLLFTFSSLASPYIIAIAENRYITSADLGGLNLVVLALIGMGILNWISYAMQIRAEARLGQSILLKLRCQLFDHLQKLSLRFFSHNEVGRIMSRVQNDVNELNEFLEAGAFWVIGEVVTMMGIMLVMLGMEWRLALITLSVVPVLILFIAYWQSRARKAFIQVRQAISGVNGALEENISGVRIIQSLSREDLNAAKFEKLNRHNFQTNVDSARISAAMMPAVELLLSVGTMVIILYGGLGVLNNTFLVGTLIAFILYINNFFDPIRNLTMEYAQLQIAMASGSRIFELLDVQPEVKDMIKPIPISRLKGDIVFDDVSFSYEPEIEVLHHLNLNINAGSTVALVGPTGAGKSTILNLLARFYDVNQGRVLVDGLNIKEIDSLVYRGQLGLVLQDPFLFSGTIRTNIQYGNLDATPKEIEEAAALVGAHEFITHLEKGYDTELEERGQNLSMGQRQLISFARAVVANPAILLLDEATASIDSYSENIIQSGLQRLTRNRTTIIIAHRLSTIRNADCIFVLNDGSLVEEGNHEDLLNQRGLYAQQYAMNFRSGRA
jgi:ATP-binding cassette, subfamily B, bacterial